MREILICEKCKTVMGIAEIQVVPVPVMKCMCEKCFLAGGKK